MSVRKFNPAGPVIFMALLFSFVSCHRYFMPVTENTGSPSGSGQFITANSPQKYFILRKGESSYALKDIVVDKTALTLSGRLSVVDPSHLLYLNTGRNNFKYKDTESGTILNEVHIFVPDNVSVDTTRTWVLPLDQISKIEVIQHDRKRTNSSYVLGGIGIGLGVMVLAGVIIALTKSSCPFISVNDGNQFNLQGELFGGAVNAQLEREDYVPLKASPVEGRYELRISNELKERQYTNFADLLLVEHPSNVTVYADEDGQWYSVQQPVAPIAALLNNQAGVLNSISRKDDVFCSFNDTTAASGINELQLSFPKNPGRGPAKLILHLKNSYWFDYLYGEFTRHFGSSYASWQQQQKSRPAAEMIRWTEEQQIPMSVALKTSDGWKEIRKIKTPGPLANRTIVIPFTPEDANGETLDLRLSTGFMFWELDYAAIDFSANTTYPVTRLHPSGAVDEKGVSVMKELATGDDLYLSQPEAGSYATITYDWNRQAQPGYVYSVILHTKGYYEPIREYSGEPQMATLNKFREPGAMARFSLERYRQIPKEHSIIALNND